MNEILNGIAANQGAVTAAATVVIAVMACLTWRVTRTLARENRLLRKAGTEPKVVAYFTIPPLYRIFWNLVLANVGQGPARNVSFKFDADEGDFEAHDVALRNSVNRTAISFLPQGESICVYFGRGPQLLKEPRLRPFGVIIEYDDMNGRHRCERCELDVAQFEGLTIIGTPPEKEIADALKDIEKHINHFASGLKRLKVETITAEDARQSKAEHKR